MVKGYGKTLYKIKRDQEGSGDGSLIRFSDSRKLVTIPFNSLSSSLRDAVYDTIRDSCESGKLAVTGAEIEACKYYFAA